MSSFEHEFETAVAQHKIPGAVLAATNKDGSFTYLRAFGVRSLKTNESLDVNHVMRIASCTKLMTSIAAMQCVERGLVGLDDDLAPVMPDLAGLKVLHGFAEDGEPVLKERKNAITLRQLLTHTAGLGYDEIPPLTKYRAKHPKVSNNPGGGATVPERFNSPLTFEPGTSWGYGTNTAWAGKLVERLTGSTLEEYMSANIWKPLGCDSITFWPDSNEQVRSRLADVSMRTRDGGLKHYAGPLLTHGATDCLGGEGAYASMPDYLKILHSLLRDDEKLLKKETAAQLFSPQLEGERKAALNKALRVSMVATLPHRFTQSLDFGLGGAIMDEDDVGRRRRGTMIWSGLPNLCWVGNCSASIPSPLFADSKLGYVLLRDIAEALVTSGANVTCRSSLIAKAASAAYTEAKSFHQVTRKRWI
ncbi:hypothetical protein LTR50_003593 [Elasticomyces elasticus]|nr:hypothetical protein LTR50_003593 [Elasticomyces elasticus]